MADYGNNFISNSGNYNYITKGHSYDDSDWVIVSLANSGNISQPIPYPNGAEFIGNNTTCFSHTNNHMSKPNREIKTGNDYVAYFNWATDNKNIKGSIDGDFNFYPFESKTDSKFVEPIGLDDTKHGVNPYINSNNNIISRTNLIVKGTTYTAGYRRHKIQYEPNIKYDLASYNYGTSGNYKSDGKTESTGGHTIISSYDAFQTFYNIKDPYSVLNISILNHDDPNSSSPVFCTLTNNKSEYKISHSYAYNPYKNTATWNNINYLSFTYNTLPTYPKELKFEYSSNYNSVSYDGDSVNVEAKAWYNNTYDRFTTSTANDDGFSSYKRYVDVTYSLSTFNSSTTPTGSDTYTFRIWQPGSKLGISYNWSIDGNPTWAHLSNTTGNTTKVTFDDQGDDKPSVSGTLSLSLEKTDIENGESTTGSVSGVSWSAPTNKSSRSCVLRQNMIITNCCAQNITPKTSTGQPYRILTLTQDGMAWNNPSFNMKWKVIQKDKITTTYADDYAHGWPTINIDEVETSDETEKTNNWNYDTMSKSIHISMPTINRPCISTYTNGIVSISKTSDTPISYKGGDVTINLKPNITFKQGFTSGVSERTWTISNIENNPTNQEYWSLNKFNDIDIKLPAIKASDPFFGDATLSWEYSGIQNLISSSKTSKIWNNDNTDDSFIITLGSNLPTIGEWYASVNDNTLTFTSTTKNSSSTSGTVAFSGSTYQDGTLTPSPSTIVISQNGTNISGTITISGTGTGISTYSASVAYPIDGNKTTGVFTLNDALQRHITGPGDLKVNIYSPTDNITVDGQFIYFANSGNPDIDSIDSKSQPWSILATSDIVSINPYHGNPIASGTVKPLDPIYHYEYKLDNDYWEEGREYLWVESNMGTVTENSSATLVSTTYTDVKDGIYKYERGHYHRNSTTEITHNLYIRVVDNNDNERVYKGMSDSKTQYGDDGDDYYVGGSWTITPDNDYNCDVSTKKINYTGDINTPSASNIGSFNVTPNWYASHVSHPTANNLTPLKHIDYVSNYSDTINRNSIDDAAPISELFGDNKEFQPNETISQEYGVVSSTPDIITTTTSTTGSITWKYKYKYSVRKYNEFWYYTEHEADGEYIPSSDTVTTKYYRCVKHTGGTWERLTESAKTFTATSTGTHTVEIAWMTMDSNGNYISDGRKGYNKHDIVITKLINTTWYRLIVSLKSDTSVEKTSFDTDGWILTATVTAQSVTCVGTPPADATWTTVTTPHITYSWEGVTSSSSTATVSIDDVTPGYNGTNKGSGKLIKVTVFSSGYDHNSGIYSDNITLYKYGKSYYNG